MTGTTRSLTLFLLARLFLTVESQTGQVLPPQNLSLLWIEDYKPMLTWTHPQHSGTNCTYDVRCCDANFAPDEKNDTSPPWTSSVPVEDFLKVSIQTVCGGERSKLTVISYPEMVKNLKGYWYSAENASVHWEPTVPTTDVVFFYRLITQDSTMPYGTPAPLQECSSYSFTEGVKTGCDLQMNLRQKIDILFNGTENKKLFRNTFKMTPRFDFLVKLPPLEWTVKKNGSKFNINWITPPDTTDYLDQFVLNYTECETLTSKPIAKEKTSTELTVVPHCRYRMTMRAVYKEINCSPWSEVKYFDADADADPHALLYAVVLIPLMFAGLTALTFVCCRKHIWKKNQICVKVPQPRDFLTDISDNNNKSTAGNLYFPAEEENCRISLVLEPEID